MNLSKIILLILLIRGGNLYAQGFIKILPAKNFLPLTVISNEDVKVDSLSVLAEIEYKKEQECLLEEWRKDCNKFYRKVDSLKNVAAILTEKSHQKGYIYYVYVESTGNTRGGYCKFIEPTIIFERCQVRDYTFWIIPNTKTFNQDNLWEGQ